MTHILLKSNSSPSKFSNSFRCVLILSFIYVIYYSYKKVVIYEVRLPRIGFNISGLVVSYHDLLMKEGDQNLALLYYRNGLPQRNSSYPFISGDTFRAMADYVFDETRQDKLQSVKYGDIVFVKGDMFYKFFYGPYKLITKPFVLVSHNSDYSAPSVHRPILKDDKIIAWYASNPDIIYHKKIFPIPLGVSNLRWSSGNLTNIMYALKNHRKPWLQRSTLLYVNFNHNSNREQRPKAILAARTFKNVLIIKTSISFQEYLEHLGNAKFVLSPPGNGLDCHRTWEALIMGAAPVVLSSGLNALFNKLPVVFVDKWSNLTEKHLLTYNFESHDNLMPVVLYARYWLDQLRQHRYK